MLLTLALVLIAGFCSVLIVMDLMVKFKNRRANLTLTDLGYSLDLIQNYALDKEKKIECT